MRKCLQTLFFFLYSRDKIYRQKYFFSKSSGPARLSRLLPPPRDKEILSRLRDARRLPTIACRTQKYLSFINHALANYQQRAYSTLFSAHYVLLLLSLTVCIHLISVLYVYFSIACLYYFICIQYSVLQPQDWNKLLLLLLLLLLSTTTTTTKA